MTNPASYQVLLVFTASSTYDVTNDVEEVSIDRKLVTWQQKTEAGQGMVRLNNPYGRYTPTNSLTDITALSTGLEIRVTGVSSGVSATRLFTGIIDEIECDTSLDGPRTAMFRCSDKAAKQLIERSVYTNILSGVCVSSMFTEVLSAAGFSSSNRSIAAIDDERAWMAFGAQVGEQGQADTGADALDTLIETGPFIGIIGRDAKVEIRDRFAANSTTSVNTYTAFWSFSNVYNDQGVINRLYTTSSVRKKSGANVDLLIMADLAPDDQNDDNWLEMPGSGQWLNFYADYFDSNATEENVWGWSVASNQFTVNRDKNNAGPDWTSSASRAFAFLGTTCVATIYWSVSSTAYVTRFNMRGRAVRKKADFSRLLEDSVSQSLYGVRQTQVTNPMFTTVAAINSFNSYVLSLYSTPAQECSVGFRNEYPFVFSQEPGDNISIVNSLANVIGKFTIMSESIRLSAGTEGWIHEVQYELRKSDRV